MKRFRNKFLYILTILLPVALIAVAILSAVKVASDILNGIKGDGIPENFVQSELVFIILAVLPWPLLRPVEKLRRHFRTESEIDEFGLNRKMNSYEKLSPEERKMLDLERLAESERILPERELKRVTHKGSENPKRDLEKLIGLSSARKKMEELSARMEYEKRKGRKERNPMHMVFVGPPGTGKTTVARIMAGFLYKNKYIKENKCIEINGAYLDSVKKTRMLMQRAKGGVLFIDEAYSLYTGSGECMQIIAEIVKTMEDEGGKFVIILAGYGKEVGALIKSNPGLESRIRHTITFQPYTIRELYEIFRMMAKSDGLTVSDECFPVFDQYMSSIILSPDFGNARAVRNYLDDCINRHCVLASGKHVKGPETLMPEDLPFLPEKEARRSTPYVEVINEDK